MAEFDPYTILAALARHDVSFVVVGGLAASLYGSPHVTFDLDVTPERSSPNLDRLAQALQELGARTRTTDVADGHPFDCSAPFRAQVTTLNLTTSAGDLDIAFIPSGTEGYDDLAPRAMVVEIHGVPVPIADLEDVIRSESAADRPKDRLVLPTLRALLARRSGGDGGSGGTAPEG